MMKFVVAALLAGATAISAPALADDKTDAKAQCVVLAKSGLPADLPPEQAPLVEKAVDGMCGCMTDKLAGLGDDGAKALRVLAKTTPEQSKEGAADPAKDKAIAISIVKAEYGMSDADATAWYDRLDPKMKEIVQTCSAEAAQTMQGAQ